MTLAGFSLPIGFYLKLFMVTALYGRACLAWLKVHKHVDTDGFH